MLAEVLVKALRGISTCATACGCCSMHKRIAENALTEYFQLLASSGVSSCACGTRPVQDDLPGERQVTNPAAPESSRYKEFTD